MVSRNYLKPEEREQAQALFNKVLTKLREQGMASVTDKGRCMYRGDGGCRCGIGWVIPDDRYSPFLEHVGIGILIDRGAFPEWEPFRELLCELQEGHDEYMPRRRGDSMREWEGWMWQIARDYRLTYVEPQP